MIVNRQYNVNKKILRGKFGRIHISYTIFKCLNLVDICMKTGQYYKNLKPVQKCRFDTDMQCFYIF